MLWDFCFKQHGNSVSLQELNMVWNGHESHTHIRLSLFVFHAYRLHNYLAWSSTSPWTCIILYTIYLDKSCVQADSSTPLRYWDMLWHIARQSTRFDLLTNVTSWSRRKTTRFVSEQSILDHATINYTFIITRALSYNMRSYNTYWLQTWH